MAKVDKWMDGGLESDWLHDDICTHVQGPMRIDGPVSGRSQISKSKKQKIYTQKHRNKMTKMSLSDGWHARSKGKKGKRKKKKGGGEWYYPLRKSSALNNAHRAHKSIIAVQ